MRQESVSVIIPSHNEALRISSTIEKVHSFLSVHFTDYEILVVDSASTDGTADAVKRSAEKFKNVCLIRTELPGKGLAVKTGMLAAKKDHVLFTDADLSAPAEEMEKLLNALADPGISLAIGSRRVPGANIINPQPLTRRILSSVLNIAIKMLFGLKINDTQCGFKMFRRDAAKQLFNMQKIDGYLFDVEILYLAKRNGYKVKEVPITWGHNPGGRVNILKELYRIPRDLISIRLIHG